MGDIPDLLNGGGDMAELPSTNNMISSALLPMLECNDEEEEEILLCSDNTNGTTNTNNKAVKPITVQKTDKSQQTEEEELTNGESGGGGSSSSSSVGICAKCQSLEAESQKALNQLTTKYETEISRLKRELETANRAKETTVMRYAKSESEVIKVKRDLETSSKQITSLMKEIESLNKKQKMLSSERERLGDIVDGKTCEIQALQKDVEKMKEEISNKDFKIKWTQNKLTTETDAHKETLARLESIEAELAKLRESNSTGAGTGGSSEGDETSYAKCDVDIKSESCNFTLHDDEDHDHEDNDEAAVAVEVATSLEEISQTEKTVVTSSIALKELEAVKLRNQQLIEENNVLSCKVQSLEQKRLDLEQKLARLQESNSEHLHQIATLQSELAATESLKSQLLREQEAVIALQNDCQQLRQAHSDALQDMAVCRSKEAELLEYTQKVTEKNVTLQSEFTSVQTKSFALEEENERLQQQIEQLQIDMKNLEKMMSQECKNYIEERETVQVDAEKQRQEIIDLQRQLDEARGEIGLLHKNLNAKIRELNKELQLARRNLKDGASGSDGMSQSSRASSSSSLNNIEATTTSPRQKHEDIPEKSSEPDTPVIPDQQLLIERIVKLQRTLAKKQEKIEFLQEHVKQLTETLQKKSKIIAAYAMNQDVEALSTELSDQNKAELVKHGGIMASVYASKQSDNGLTLDLSLEINRKLQIVLEDTLMKNITLKDSLNTLGREISKLTEENNDLAEKLANSANPGG